MARTPWMSSLQRAMRDASTPRDRKGESPPGWDRRRFLATTLKASAALGADGVLSACGKATALAGLAGPNGTLSAAGVDPGKGLAIVGGGLAGLTCAHLLRKAGYTAIVYEASKRIGGRVYSVSGAMAPGLTTEFGAEFIDSTHADMLALVREFGLPLADTFQSSEAAVQRYAFFFEGRHRSLVELEAALKPVMKRIRPDRDAIPDDVTYQTQGRARELDRLSLAQYLDRVGADGWLRRFIEASYVSEYGLDPDEQSALNLLTLVPGEEGTGKFDVYDGSDERYKVVGGNQRVTDELARRLGDQMRPEHRLLALRSAGSGYVLTFQTPSGTKDVTAGAVVLCLPFTGLRDVSLKVELPEIKRRCIQELQYGSNSKLMLGFDRRVWREQGFAGYFFADGNLQIGWDNAWMQPDPAGGITLFSGGKRGQATAGDPTSAEVSARLADLERVYPGIRATHNGRAFRCHWPTYPFIQGSYSCYGPGGWTTFGGIEAKPVGNLFFAGEHCSGEFQGYMNGAAKTGREAAEALIKRLSPVRHAMLTRAAQLLLT